MKGSKQHASKSLQKLCQSIYISQWRKGLSYIQFKQFLEENINMKLNIKARLVRKHDKDTGEMVELLQNLPATRFDIYNKDDLVSALDPSNKNCLELKVQNDELRSFNSSKSPL